MIKVAGVRFRNAGKVYYFDPKDFNLKPGMHVIVETARGMEYGTISGPLREVQDDKVTQPLKAVVRIATKEDDDRCESNQIKEKEAIRICKEKIRKHDLDMKLIDAEYAFDNNKIMFYFTADGRVDFRELVKDLASVFRTRIELRQIGVRDETKMLGGIGICGRPLCCASWMNDFIPVSIKMAKEQNLSLNPTKISGVCGRLMCCLKNEEETYEYLNSNLPAMGDFVTLPDGREGKVKELNVLRQKVKVLLQDGDDIEIEEFPVEELSFRPRKSKGGKGGNGSKDRDGRKNDKDNGGNAGNDNGVNNGENREGGERKERRERPERKDRKDRENNRENREGREKRENGEGREGGRENREGGERKERRERPERKDRKDRENRENREGREGNREGGERRERKERQNRENAENRERSNASQVNGQEGQNGEGVEGEAKKKRPRRRHRGGRGRGNGENGGQQQGGSAE